MSKTAQRFEKCLCTGTSLICINQYPKMQLTDIQSVVRKYEKRAYTLKTQGKMQAKKPLHELLNGLKQRDSKSHCLIQLLLGCIGFSNDILKYVSKDVPINEELKIEYQVAMVHSFIIWIEKGELIPLWDHTQQQSLQYFPSRKQQSYIHSKYQKKPTCFRVQKVLKMISLEQTLAFFHVLMQ